MPLIYTFRLDCASITQRTNEWGEPTTTLNGPISVGCHLELRVAITFLCQHCPFLPSKLYHVL